MGEMAYRLCTSTPSPFLDCKFMSTSISPSSSSSSSSLNFKVQNFTPSHKLSSLPPQPKPLLHPTHVSLQDPIPQATQDANSHQVANSHDPDAKFPSLSKNSIWVNSRSPRAKQLRKKFYAARSNLSLVNVAKSLDSCNPCEQEVSEILNGLGDKILERDAVFILDNMVNPETVLLAFKYFQHKIKPAKHVVLYNVTLKLFRGAKDFQGAEKLLDEMIQRGVVPNVITFATIISCASMCSFAHKAVEWFEKMPSFGCEPDDNICSSMIYAYARTGNVDMAMDLYERAKRGKWHIERVAFSTLIKMHGMAGNFDGCLSIYKEMKGLGGKPNLVTYNTMLYSMARAKRAREAKTIYEDMIKDGFSPNWATYAALLEAYCRGRFCEEALSVYKEMKEKGMDLNTVLHNMLLAMCAAAGHADKAEEIFEDLKSSGTCRPDSFTFLSLINMYSCIGKVPEAEAMLSEMINCGFQPNIFVLTSLVQCYGKAKRTDDVVKVFNQLLDLDITPDDRFCDCLLNVMTQAPKEVLGKLTDCIEKANPKLGSVVRYLVEEQEDDGDFRKETSELFNSIDADLRRSFCNCLMDLCVNLNVNGRARDLLDLGLTLEIYTDLQSRTQTSWYLHLKRLSLGAALTALHVWMDDLSKALESGENLPSILGITGLGKQKVLDEGFFSAFESHLKELNAPFHEASHQAGWFLTTNVAAKLWLQSRGSSEIVAGLNPGVLGVPTMAQHQC